MAEAGRVKLLGVSGTKRLKLFPNVPTLAEQGFTAPIFSMNAGWIGIIAPAGTPAAIVKKLGAAYDQAVRDPDIHEKLVDLGLDPIGGDGAMFQATYERERPVWRKLLVGAGLDVKPE
jgi:tripartite-type tricarboxylate transporter receptor subunit TctC